MPGPASDPEDLAAAEPLAVAAAPDRHPAGARGPATPRPARRAAVSSSIPRHDRPARRLERDERRQRLRPGVVVGHAPRRPARTPSPGRQRSGHGSDADPEVERVGRRGPSPRPSSRRAPRRARGRPTIAPPTARPVEALRAGIRACRPTGRSRSASPIAWARRGVVGVDAVADEDRLDLRAERREVGDAHRRPAVGRPPRRPGTRRSAGSRRAAASGRVAASRPASNSAIAGRNSPAPTSATGPGMAVSLWTCREHIRACRCDTAGHMTRAPALDPDLPRSSARAPSSSTARSSTSPSSTSARSCRGDARRRPRGPGLRRQRLPGGPGGAADPRRRACPTTTAGAGSSPSAWPGSAATSALCGLAPTLEWLIVFRLAPGRRRRAARSRVAGAHHRRPSTGASAGRAFGHLGGVDRRR